MGIRRRSWIRLPVAGRFRWRRSGLGLEAHASDLNPVAVLINKALIEIPPRWADCPPVHPDAENRTRWKGAEGLGGGCPEVRGVDARRGGARIGHLYPKATSAGWVEANVIAWIWARTVDLPEPGLRSDDATRLDRSGSARRRARRPGSTRRRRQDGPVRDWRTAHPDRPEGP